MRLFHIPLVLALLLPAASLAADEPKVLAVDATVDHILGDRDAQASMIVYSDFQCPFCKRYHPVVEEIRAKYPQVRIVYRNFPLSSIHANALIAAKAAECVARQRGDSGYWTYLATVLAADELSETLLKEWAAAQGVESTSFATCLTDATILDKIKADVASGKAAGVSGTPTTFLINPEGTAFKIVGSVPLATIEKRLDTFKFEEKKTTVRIQTSKRKARVRATVPGVRRWR